MGGSCASVASCGACASGRGARPEASAFGCLRRAAWPCPVFAAAEPGRFQHGGVRACPLVGIVLLDQQPAFALLPSARLQPDQHEAALQPLARRAGTSARPCARLPPHPRPPAPRCRGPRSRPCRRRSCRPGSRPRRSHSRPGGPRHASPAACACGSSDGPFGTAQLHSTPSCSSRKSQCSRVASCFCTTKIGWTGPAPDAPAPAAAAAPASARNRASRRRNVASRCRSNGSHARWNVRLFCGCRLPP